MKDTEYKSLMSDAWKIYAKHKGKPLCEAEFDSLDKDTQELFEKYKKEHVVDLLIQALISQLRDEHLDRASGKQISFF